MIIQKFGGIAMRDSCTRKACIRHIRRAIRENGKVVIVVSAMGRAGDPYSTDSLLSISGALGISPHAQDVAAGCGELLASAIMSAELEKEGIENELIYGSRSGILTEGPFGSADLKMELEPFYRIWGARNVAVVPGFQGTGLDGRIRTTGRGGSDLTAVVLGEMLGAELVEFFKDVPGVLETDPAINPDAKKFESLTYAELLPLLGTERPVIQKKAALYAAKASVPLHIRNFADELPGTFVSG
ncbi:aspartate kinase [Bhargavaea ginsengi]|uniref:amino acid kinase family protein n=1 Tax=Bhargavaea ginsengi TaxID=426757 RepID=UPI003C783D6B